MKRTLRRSLLAVALILSVLMIISGCAASKKNPHQQKSRHTYLDTTQLGRNKYFFSKEYQRKLYRYKKK